MDVILLQTPPVVVQVVEAEAQRLMNVVPSGPFFCMNGTIGMEDDF